MSHPTPRPDPLDEAVRAFRGRPVPPSRPGLEAELLAAFDRAHGRGAGRVRRAAAWLAAAALVLVALRLGVPPSAPSSPLTAAEAAAVARIDARLGALLDDLAALEAAPRRAPAALPEPEVPPPAALFEAHAARDVALYRLAAARTYEEVDPAAAARRYRELLAREDLDGEGPAAAVARRRLAALDR